MKNVGQLVINGMVAPGFEPIRLLYERNMRNLLREILNYAFILRARRS